VAAGGKALPGAGHAVKRATNVIDLAAVLQQSLAEAAGHKKVPAAGKNKSRRKAA